MASPEQPQSPKLPTCRRIDYSNGAPQRCDKLPVIQGYCREHAPDHLTRQHYTRTLTARVVEAAGKVASEYRASAGKRVSEHALDSLVLAYQVLDEWRKS